MDLILWRHADAEPGGFDLDRELTAKGHDQAARVAKWLLRRLPEDFDVLASPAVRAQQTAAALKVKAKTVKSLAPGARVSEILKAAGWPQGKGTVIVVGHQPEFGCTAAYVLTGQPSEWRLKKGGLWWFSAADPVVVKAEIGRAHV